MKRRPHLDTPSSRTVDQPRIKRLAKRSIRELLQRFGQYLSDMDNSTLDRVETVHQLRVTSRRADVALRIFKAWLPDVDRKRMQKTLREVRDEAGVVRDLDLLERRWGRTVDSVPVPISAPTKDWLTARIRDLQTDARRQLNRWTRRSTRARMKKRSAALVRRVRRRITRTAVAAVHHALAKLAGRLITALPTTANSLREAHRTRIRARQLRYALELLRPVLPDGADAVRPMLIQMQDELGRLNDDATAIRFLRNSMEACAEPDVLSVLRQLLEQAESAASRHLAQWTADMAQRIEQLDVALRESPSFQQEYRTR